MGPLQKQYLLLTTEPSLQPILFFTYWPVFHCIAQASLEFAVHLSTGTHSNMALDNNVCLPVYLDGEDVWMVDVRMPQCVYEFGGKYSGDSFLFPLHVWVLGIELWLLDLVAGPFVM